MPTTRALVAQYAASPVTVQKALRVLRTEGLLETRVGTGTFVRATPKPRPHDFSWQARALPVGGRTPRESTALRSTPNDMIALHSGYPDRELLPERLVRAAFTRAARGEAALNRSPAAGLPELQSWFAGELGEFAPAGVAAPSAADAVVLPGSQSGLGSAFRALVGPGRPLLIESPSYWGAILAARQVGVQLVPVPSGIHGPDPDLLARAFAETGARAFYAQPTFANPTGAHWSPALGDHVVEIVKQHDAFLIEDDWAHDFGIDAAPTPLAARDDSGHVVYLRSLTKSVSPAMRVAGIIARGPARDRILADVQAQSMYVSGMLQAAALDVVTQPAWRTHLRGLSRHLGARRDLLVGGIREFVPSADVHAVPKGGLNLWIRLPDELDLPRLVHDCTADGVVVAAGDQWFPHESSGPHLRLNYSGPNPGAFREAARVIGEAVAAQRLPERRAEAPLGR